MSAMQIQREIFAVTCCSAAALVGGVSLPLVGAAALSDLPGSERGRCYLDKSKIGLVNSSVRRSDRQPVTVCASLLIG